MKRAIVIGGGGPAVGLALGALKRLEEVPELNFDVWSLSSVGSWLGLVYNAAEEGRRFASALAFFEQVMRPDEVYSHFPIPTLFAPDFAGMSTRLHEHLARPATYRNLFLPEHWIEANRRLWSLAADPGRWNAAEFNAALLNDVLAVNPMARFLCSMIYRSGITGLARFHYDEAQLASVRDGLKIERVFQPDRPTIYINAYNMTDQRLELFVNDLEHPIYKPITVKGLMAGSSLPYILEPIAIDGKDYCEGAIVDTVNFKDLIDNHPDLDEIWVIRLLGRNQIRRPETLLDSLNNLIMMFAASASEDAITLMRFFLQERRSRVRLIEVPVDQSVDYEWSLGNLQRSVEAGYRATETVVAGYRPRNVLAPALNPLAAMRNRGRDAGKIDHSAGWRLDRLPEAGAIETLGRTLDDLARLTAQLPRFMILARSAIRALNISEELAALQNDLETQGIAIQEALEELDAQPLDPDIYELMVVALDLGLLLRSVARSLAEIVNDLRKHAREPRLAEHAPEMVEGMNGVLLALTAAAHSRSREAIGQLQTLARERASAMRRLRFEALVSGAAADQPSRERTGLLAVESVIERGLQKIQRSARLFERLGGLAQADGQPWPATLPGYAAESGASYRGPAIPV
jgi:predicted acylesterase/phospholipase RssA